MKSLAFDAVENHIRPHLLRHIILEGYMPDRATMAIVVSSYIDGAMTVLKAENKEYRDDPSNEFATKLRSLLMPLRIEIDSIVADLKRKNTERESRRN